MTETKDQAMATLLARLATQEMLGFRVTSGVDSQAVTKVGSGKVGSPKPPPTRAAKQD